MLPKTLSHVATAKKTGPDAFTADYARRRTIEITTIATCPINCAKYCPQDVLKKAYSGHSLLRLEDFRVALSHVPKDVRIHFSGYGEPLLNPAAKDMMQYAHTEGYDLVLFTTLANITPDIFRAIQSIPFQHICVHLPDANGITKVRLSSDYFSVLESMKQMPTVTFMALGNILQEIRRILPTYRYTFRSNERGGNCRNITPRRKLGWLHCFKLKYPQFVMLPDGTVTLCCMDYGMKHRLGNLLMDQYDDLVKSEEMNRVLSSTRSFRDPYALCRTCRFALSPAARIRRVLRSGKGMIELGSSLRYNTPTWKRSLKSNRPPIWGNVK